MITNLKDEEEKNESFCGVKKLRHINDLTLQVKACCISNRDLVRMLKATESAEESNWSNELLSYETSLNGYIENSTALMHRIRNTIDLVCLLSYLTSLLDFNHGLQVGYTLTLRNQIEASNITKELRDLTGEMQRVTRELKDLQQDNLDDSAAAKVLATVSALYLPGSFFVVSFHYRPSSSFFLFSSSCLSSFGTFNQTAHRS
jgi:hypothetical protein